MPGYTRFMVLRDALDHNIKHITLFGAPKTEAYKLIAEIKKIIDDSKTPANGLYASRCSDGICSLCYQFNCSCFKIY